MEEPNCSLKTFIDKFCNEVNVNDPLPFKVSNYRILNQELPAELVSLSLQYLRHWNCPQDIVYLLAHTAANELLSINLKSCESDTIAFLEKVFEPLKLLQVVQSKVNEICQRYKTGPLPKVPYAPMSTVSVFAIKNSRRTMEDRHIVVQDVNQLFGIEDMPHTNYFGVFDGHAGTEAACYAATYLHANLARNHLYSENLPRALHDAFIITDHMFCKKASVESMKSGTTAVCGVIRDEKLHVAWLGDSQAVIVINRVPTQLVIPHKPEHELERQRVEEQGGSVIHYGTWRVNGQLAVSRAIGDVEYKPYVTAKPSILTIDLDDQAEFLVFACDGLWDALNEQDVCDIVLEHLKDNPGDCEGVSRELSFQAKQKGSSDNITVIVVFLKPVEYFSNPPPPQSNYTPTNPVPLPPIMDPPSSPEQYNGEREQFPGAGASKVLSPGLFSRLAEPTTNGQDQPIENGQAPHSPVQKIEWTMNQPLVDPALEADVCSGVVDDSDDDNWSYYRVENSQKEEELLNKEVKSISCNGKKDEDVSRTFEVGYEQVPAISSATHIEYLEDQSPEVPNKPFFSTKDSEEEHHVPMQSEDGVDASMRPAAFSNPADFSIATNLEWKQKFGGEEAPLESGPEGLYPIQTVPQQPPADGDWVMLEKKEAQHAEFFSSLVDNDRVAQDLLRNSDDGEMGGLPETSVDGDDDMEQPPPLEETARPGERFDIMQQSMDQFQLADLLKVETHSKEGVLTETNEDESPGDVQRPFPREEEKLLDVESQIPVHEKTSLQQLSSENTTQQQSFMEPENDLLNLASEESATPSPRFDKNPTHVEELVDEAYSEEPMVPETDMHSLVEADVHGLSVDNSDALPSVNQDLGMYDGSVHVESNLMDAEVAKEEICVGEGKEPIDLYMTETKHDDVAMSPHEDVTLAPHDVAPEHVTPEPHEEVTQERHEQVTPEPHEQVTPEPHEQVTPEPHEQVTPEPHEQVTPEPHEQVTPEPHEEVTPEPHEEVTQERHKVVTPEPHEHVTPEPHEEVTQERHKVVTPEPHEHVTPEPHEDVLVSHENNEAQAPHEDDVVLASQEDSSHLNAIPGIENVPQPCLEALQPTEMQHVQETNVHFESAYTESESHTATSTLQEFTTESLGFTESAQFEKEVDAPVNEHESFVVSGNVTAEEQITSKEKEYEAHETIPPTQDFTASLETFSSTAAEAMPVEAEATSLGKENLNPFADSIPEPVTLVKEQEVECSETKTTSVEEKTIVSVDTDGSQVVEESSSVKVETTVTSEESTVVAASGTVEEKTASTTVEEQTTTVTSVENHEEAVNTRMEEVPPPPENKSEKPKPPSPKKVAESKSPKKQISADAKKPLAKGKPETTHKPASKPSTSTTAKPEARPTKRPLAAPTAAAARKPLARKPGPEPTKKSPTEPTKKSPTEPTKKSPTEVAKKPPTEAARRPPAALSKRPTSDNASRAQASKSIPPVKKPETRTVPLTKRPDSKPATSSSTTVAKKPEPRAASAPTARKPASSALAAKRPMASTRPTSTTTSSKPSVASTATARKEPLPKIDGVAKKPIAKSLSGRPTQSTMAATKKTELAKPKPEPLAAKRVVSEKKVETSPRKFPVPKTGATGKLAKETTNQQISGKPFPKPGTKSATAVGASTNKPRSASKSSVGKKTPEILKPRSPPDNQDAASTPSENGEVKIVQDSLLAEDRVNVKLDLSPNPVPSSTEAKL